MIGLLTTPAELSDALTAGLEEYHVCQSAFAKRKQKQTWLARPQGLEPRTPRFEAWCSIQLSYGRMRDVT